MEVRILTCVTNAGGVGPGHSAVVVGSRVFTFEDVGGGWGQSGSGWLKFDLSTYLGDNEHRPVLLQSIPTAVGSYVIEYVDKSIKNDDDYIGSGVCSQQVARAVNYSLPKDVDFDPKGFDTPFGVYWCARRLSLVSLEDYKWPGKSTIGTGTKDRIVDKLKVDYPDAHKVLK